MTLKPVVIVFLILSAGVAGSSYYISHQDPGEGVPTNISDHEGPAIAGQAIIGADVGTSPVTPLRHRVVLAIPCQRFTDFSRIDCFSESMAFAQFRIDPTEISPDALAWTLTDSFGWYQLTIPHPGNYAICLTSDSRMTNPEAAPFLVSGCAVVTLPNQQLILSDIVSGEGGTRASPRLP